MPSPFGEWSKTKNIVNSIELSWEASTTSEVEPTYYIVYLEKDGNWEELAKTKELKYSYKDKNGLICIKITEDKIIRNYL